VTNIGDRKATSRCSGSNVVDSISRRILPDHGNILATAEKI